MRWQQIIPRVTRRGCQVKIEMTMITVWLIVAGLGLGILASAVQQATAR